MMDALQNHWSEYLIEAVLLGSFMIAACVFGVILEHPRSPVPVRVPNAAARRAMMGFAMGLTAVVLIYSPWGQQSGAHMNPATTTTFWLRGKVASWDAAGYIAAQFLGAAAGVALSRAALRDWLRHDAVNHVVTRPGPRGAGFAWLTEAGMALMLMLMVLFSSNDAEFAPYTGFIVGALVALFIFVAAPISGMSLNPARTFGSAIIARQWHAYWVYATAPLTGMLLASAGYAALPAHNHVYCAKLNHCNDRRCIFNCEFENLRPPRRTDSRVPCPTTAP